MKKTSISVDEDFHKRLRMYAVSTDSNITSVIMKAVEKYIAPVQEPKATPSVLRQVAIEAGGNELFERYRKFRNEQKLECLEAYRIMLEKGLDVLEAEESK